MESKELPFNCHNLGICFFVCPKKGMLSSRGDLSVGFNYRCETQPQRTCYCYS